MESAILLPKRLLPYSDFFREHSLHHVILNMRNWACNQSGAVCAVLKLAQNLPLVMSDNRCGCLGVQSSTCFMHLNRNRTSGGLTAV